MIFRKLEELKPHPQNDYYFDDTEEAAFKLLKDDIESYGKIRNPILISTNNIIISGHQRYRAYQELGKEQIQCVELDKRLTDEDLEYILIMENLTARNSSKSSNKLKLGRCINKICEYCNLSNGNNQYTGKRVGNNFLPKEIKSFKSKQEIADAFELTTRTLNDYQSLARNGIEELETIVENGKINDTSAIKISRLPKEKQEEVVEEISSMNKATVKDVADIINSINNKTTKMGVEEVTTPKTQYDPNSVTFEDLESYNRHGNGDKSTIEALKELKNYVNNPEENITYLQELKFCYEDLITVLEEYSELFRNNHITSDELEDLKEDISAYYFEWFSGLASDMEWLMDYIDTVSGAIEDIKELEHDYEICSCDQDGILYNGAGKKIAQIEDYKTNSLKYNSIKKDDDGIFYAYDKNNEKIGKVRFIK